MLSRSPAGSLVLFAALLGAAASPVDAQSVSVFADASGGVLPILQPSGLAVDGTGNVYVADSILDHVVRFAPDGTWDIVLDASGDGAGHALEQPGSLALDPSGKLIVAGRASHNVFEVTPVGSVSVILDATGDGLGNPLQTPGFLVTDSYSNVYVTGTDSDNVFKITRAGTITQIIDATGDGLGHALDAPGGIAVHFAGGVVVTGSGSDNVFRIDRFGVITQILDATGDGGSHPLAGPNGVGFDFAGNAYIAGGLSDNVLKVPLIGAVSGILDASGDGLGHVLGGPRGVAVHPDGQLEVCGANSDTVLRVAADGTVRALLDLAGTGPFYSNPLRQPEVAVVAASGDIYVTGVASGNVFRIEPGGLAHESVHTPWMRTPVCLATDAAGTLFVANSVFHNVLAIGADGAGEVIIDVTGDGLGNFLQYAEGVAVDDQGEVYVSGRNSINIFAVAPTGAIRMFHGIQGTPPLPLNQVGNLDIDSAGNVYYTSGAAFVFKVTPDGVSSIVHTGTFIRALHVGVDDVLYVSAFNGLTAIDVDGSKTMISGLGSPQFMTTDAEGRLIASLVSIPGGGTKRYDGSTVTTLSAHAGPVTVGRWGDLYIRDNMTRRVYKVSPSGVESLVLDETTPGISLAHIHDIHADGAGRVFVARLSASGILLITEPEDPWTDLGGATPGISGLSELTMTALLEAGYPFERTLSNAAPDTLGFTWLSFASMPMAAFGGTLHAIPMATQFAFLTDGNGSSTATGIWPLGVPPGIDITLQDLVQDDSVPAGITLSNAVTATTP